MTGPGYAAQGNILVSERPSTALADDVRGDGRSRPLAESLLAALAAAQAGRRRPPGPAVGRALVVREGGGYDGCGVARRPEGGRPPEPIAELARLYGLHQLYFGETPADEWLAVDAELAEELRERLGRLGQATGDLASDLATWAGIENLEEAGPGRRADRPGRARGAAGALNSAWRRLSEATVGAGLGPPAT